MFGIIFCLRLPVLNIKWDDTSISECTKATRELKSASVMRLMQIKPTRQKVDTVFMLIVTTLSVNLNHTSEPQIIPITEGSGLCLKIKGP